MKPTDLHPDDLLGVIKVDGISQLFAGVVAEWILDYKRYDPAFAERDDVSTFRSGLLSVDSESANRYLEAMQPYRLELPALAKFLRVVGPSQWPLSIYVDFDAQLQVCGFGEVPICDYVPKGWECSYENPLSYVPAEIASVWNANGNEG